MDAIISALPFTEDGDLRLCPEKGIAYQHDQTTLVEYDAAYFAKYCAYEGSEISNRINAGRVALVNKYTLGPVVDIGIGSGEFIKHRHLTWGYDVNPVAKRWLRENRLWADELHSFDGYTMWDVTEHVPTPLDYFQNVKAGGFLFTSIPIFEDITKVRESKHYRPSEHLYYWTRHGFVWWMAQHGFAVLEVQDFETKAGRDSILSYAFWRV